MMHVETMDDATHDEIGYWEAFVVQTDWSGKVMQESWYGHHNPCCRIAMFVILSSICSTAAVALHAFQRWPILHPFLTIQELDYMKDSHEKCVAAICQSVEHIEFDCEMIQEGRVVLDRFTVSVDRVPLPLECHEAIRVTFGDDFLDEGMQLEGNTTTIAPTRIGNAISNKGIDLIHFQDLARRKGLHYNVPIFQILPDQCLLQENLLEYHFSLVDSITMQPGSRERIELRNFACPEHMSRQTPLGILPKSMDFYGLIMAWRRSGTLFLLCLLHVAGNFAKCAARALFLLVPSLLLWIFVLPKDEIRGCRISLFSTISTLLLLRTLSDNRGGEMEEMIRTGIVFVSATSFANQKAAMEWVFLFFVSYMDFGIIWDSWNDTVADSFDRAYTSKNILDGIRFLIALLIPGSGFWKLVTVYVVYMAFPKSKKEQDPK